MKVKNVLGSVGNTISYQTGYSGGIGTFNDQEMRLAGINGPKSFNQTSQVAYNGARGSEHDLN